MSRIHVVSGVSVGAALAIVLACAAWGTDTQPAVAGDTNAQPAASGGTDAQPGAAGFTAAQADETVLAHNAWRQRAGVRPLRWAADLASRADLRARYLAGHGCVMKHGFLPDDLGENLYWAGPLQGPGFEDEVFAVTPSHVVDMWGAESADYSTADGTCTPNRQCGHYTQIVWAATEEVGCGMSICPTLGQIWVCNYRPRGNVYRF